MRKDRKFITSREVNYLTNRVVDTIKRNNNESNWIEKIVYNYEEKELLKGMGICKRVLRRLEKELGKGYVYEFYELVEDYEREYLYQIVIKIERKENYIWNLQGFEFKGGIK